MGDASYDRKEKLFEIYKKLFPSSEHSKKAIYQRIHDEIGRIICRRCSAEIQKVSIGHKELLCSICKYSFHLTTGTIFERMKRPRAWHAAIWFLEQGSELSSPELSTLGEAAVSTCWEILQKVKLLIENARKSQIQLRTLKLDVQDFIEVVSKRSLETPAFGRPMDEAPKEAAQSKINHRISQQLIEPRAFSSAGDKCSITPGYQSNSNCSNEIQYPRDLDSLEKEILLNLQLNVDSMSVDNIANSITIKDEVSYGAVSSSLMMLELKGLVSRSFGDVYSLCNGTNSVSTTKVSGKSKADCIDSIVLAHTMKSARIIYRGVSRKYLQLYVSLSWYLVDKVRWPEGALFSLCIKAPPVSCADIRRFSSGKILELLSV